MKAVLLDPGEGLVPLYTIQLSPGTYLAMACS